MPGASVVQQVDRDATFGGGTSFLFGSAFTAGNSVYVLVQVDDLTTSAAVSDDAPNTYTLLAGPVTLNGTRYWLWRATSVLGTQPQFTFTIPSQFAQIAAWEVNGDASSSPIDTGIVANSVNDASPTSGTVTVSTGGDLILATLWTPGFGRAAALDASFTHIEGTQGPWGSVGNKSEAGTSFTEIGSVSSAVTWYVIVVPVKAAGGGPPIVAPLGVFDPQLAIRGWF